MSTATNTTTAPVITVPSTPPVLTPEVARPLLSQRRDARVSWEPAVDDWSDDLVATILGLRSP